MLRTHPMSDDRRKQALETIDRNALAQTQLIEDLLDIGRIVAGKLRLAVEAVDLRSIVEAAMDSIRPTASARRIDLPPLEGDGDGSTEGDADRLLQIVWNLLSNAVKFTPPGGRVTVAFRRTEGHLELTVTDTGEGIDPAFLPFVFDRFRQGDPSTTRAHGGLGLGLAIVRHLVELHGGTISAESQGRGRGATFRVRLPAVTTASSGAPAEAGRSARRREGLSPRTLDGVAVLLVDDDADARAVLLEHRAQEVARVGAASGAPEAFDCLKSKPPDVVVSDIGMPGEDGYALVGRIRSLPPEHGGRTPAIALTAYSRGCDRTRALLAGFDAHVPKPVHPVELVAMIASIASRAGVAR
jgi:CheY-like chemotaxis protein/two-component sensor histidine kinase